MAEQDIRVRGAVAIADNSQYSVAYKLMDLIAAHEGEGTKRDRAYWIKLYCQCYKATHGYGEEQILGNK